MSEKSFRHRDDFDSKLRQRLLDRHGGEPPDNFIASSEGGAVDSELLEEKENATEERDAIDGLTRRLAQFCPEVLDNEGELRWDATTVEAKEPRPD